MHYLHAMFLCLLLWVIQPEMIWADGGILQLSQKCGDCQVSVFTSPAVLRCGLIDISILMQDAATGRVNNKLPIVVRLKQIGESNTPQQSDVLEQQATSGAASNKLLQAAVFDVPQQGKWQVNVYLGDNSIPLEFNLHVSPPLPAWLELAPWIVWPIVVIALFLVHQRLTDSPHTERSTKKRSQEIATGTLLRSTCG